MDKKPKVIVQGRDVTDCPKADCIHHPVNDGDGQCGCVAGEWGMYAKSLAGPYQCPVCGCNPIDAIAQEKAKELCREYGLAREQTDPGGRVLQFPFGACRIYNQCAWCDYEKIKKYCEE